MEKLIITGNLGKDAQTQIKNNEEVCFFSVGCNRKYKQDGVDKEVTTWYNCSIWRPSRVKEFLRKGQMVLVEGTPKVHLYQNRNGETAATVNVNVTHVELLGKRPDESTAAFSPALPAPDLSAAAPFDPVKDGGDDLPF